MQLEHYGGTSFVRSAKNKLLYQFFRQTWNIAVTNYPVTAVAGLEGARKQREALSELVWMQESRGAFAADPFVMASTGNSSEITLFYEHFEWKKNLGCIHTISYDKNSHVFGKTGTLLENQTHLSYPYLFESNDSYFCLPENSQTGDLSFYELDENNSAGAKHSIPGMDLVDSTIVFWSDLYWMFATLAGPQDNSHLYIFYAPDPIGTWKPHERNPVKIDRANARPAGQPIIHRGKLFRPAQDCKSHYGSAIIINEVSVLTSAEFVETPVAEIRPEPGSRYDFGLHTISYADDVTVIDGARLECKLHPGLDGLANYLR